MLVADPRELVWTRQPSQVRAGEPITPPPRIELLTDGADDPYVQSIEVTVRIASGPPGGRLSGTTTVRGEGSVCEFHDLRVQPPGEYTLIAELDEKNIEYLYPGLDESQEGLLARYRPVPGVGLVDIYGNFPPLVPVDALGNPMEAIYGIRTPVGPIGAQVTGGRWQALAPMPVDFVDALTVMAYVYHPGTRPGRPGFAVLQGDVLSGGNWSLRCGFRMTSPDAAGRLLPEAWHWNGNITRAINATVAYSALSSGFHLLGFSSIRMNPGSQSTLTFFLDGVFVGGMRTATLDAPLWAGTKLQRLQCTIGAQPGDVIGEIAIFDRSFDLDGHRLQAQRYGVHP